MTSERALLAGKSWVRPAAMAGLALVGLLVGLLGGFVQADRWVVGVPWGILAVPWGMAVVLVTLVVAVRGAVWLVLTRWGGGMLFAGWLLATLAMATQSPSGDLAISAGARQWTYVIAGVVLGSAAVTFPVVNGGAGDARQDGYHHGTGSEALASKDGRTSKDEPMSKDDGVPIRRDV